MIVHSQYSPKGKFFGLRSAMYCNFVMQKTYATKTFVINHRLVNHKVHHNFQQVSHFEFSVFHVALCKK